MIEKIAELVITKKLPTLADIRDESSDTIRIVLEPKSRSTDAAMLMEQLFRQTELETRFSLNMNVLDASTTPRVDRKSTRLNSSHVAISYAVFCLK